MSEIEELVKRLRGSGEEFGYGITGLEAADALEAQAARVMELEIGLQGIVALQSSVPRSAIREAAAEILKGNTGSLPDQSPFLNRIAALQREKEALCEMLNISQMGESAAIEDRDFYKARISALEAQVKAFREASEGVKRTISFYEFGRSLVADKSLAALMSALQMMEPKVESA